jgi:hypothetical protein
MSSPQLGQRGEAKNLDSLLSGIVLMSNLLTVFCIGAHPRANHAFGSAA